VHPNARSIEDALRAQSNIKSIVRNVFALGARWHGSCSQGTTSGRLPSRMLADSPSRAQKGAGCQRNQKNARCR
jgi:hypothetical protein